MSFTIHKGETFGIVGESGCGKTTCGKTCTGILTKTDGQVLYQGKDVHQMSKADRNAFTQKVQTIFQDPYASLDPHQKVYQIVSEGMRIHHLTKSKEEEQKRVMELLEMVGLNAEHATRNVHEFSGGQRQGWRISDEKFMKGLSWIDDLKVRYDYGVTGNQEIGNYNSLATYRAFGWYQYNGNRFHVWGPSKNTNSELRWEKGHNQNVGLDFSLFSHKVTGSFNYFHRKQSDLLGDYSVPVPPNLFSTIYTNVGTLRNTGFELDVTVNAVRTKDFTYSFTLVGATNNNKFVSFSNDIYKGQKYYSTCSMANPNNPGYLQRIEEGERIGNYFTYRYAGVDKKGDWLIYDKKGNVIPVAQGTEEDKSVTGNGLPKFTGSMTHNFTYKNFDLSVALRGAAGFDIFNVHDFYFGLQSMTTNQLTTAYSKNAHITTGKNVITDYFIEPGDYLKIDNVTLGYTMNLNKKYIEKIRLFGTANNLYTFTKFTGVDPSTYEVNGLTPGTFGGGYNYYPSAFQFILGLQVSF